MQKVKRDTVMRLKRDQYTVKYNDRKEVRILRACLFSLFFVITIRKLNVATQGFL